MYIPDEISRRGGHNATWRALVQHVAPQGRCRIIEFVGRLTVVVLSIVYGGDGVFAQPPSIDMLRNQLDAAHARYKDNIQQIAPISSAGLVGPRCQGKMAYDSDDVLATLTGAKSQLLQAVGSSGEADALRAYVDRKFPAAPSGSTSECFPGFSVVSNDEYRGVLGAVESLFNTLKGMPSLSVSFDVISRPTGANIELRSEGSATTKKQNTTDARLNNVYRGLYVLNVSDNLRKPARLALDLVDDPPATVDCVLVAISDNSTSTCRATK
jgi:hypothetical protein